MPLTRPEPLADTHDLAAFDSGVASLDDWLRRPLKEKLVERLAALLDGQL